MMKMIMAKIRNSISEVFEKMFFLPVAFQPSSSLPDCGLEDKADNLACQLTFSGDINGRLILVVPASLIAVMTENFMGESSKNLTLEHLTGTLSETVNIVCGNGLSSVTCEKPYELGLPQVISDLDEFKDIPFNIVQVPDTSLFAYVVLHD